MFVYRLPPPPPFPFPFLAIFSPNREAICKHAKSMLNVSGISSQEVFHGKPQTAKCHVTTALRSRLQFAVHVWTAGGAYNGKWFTTRFFATKNCTASRLKARTSFYILLRCVCWIFELESMNYSCFWGDKSDALPLGKKQHGGTKQWTPC